MSGNFSDMAHIIGAKEDGPRGGPDSDKLARDARNIMIVKKKHEYRIDRVTGITVDQKTEVPIKMDCLMDGL